MISLRSTHLQTECQKLRDKGHTFLELSKTSLRHLIVNDKQRTMYCYVPKVACTNLKRIFLFLTGKVNVTNPSNLTPRTVHGAHFHTLLSSYSSKEIEYRLKNYRKVVFVREPLVRLLSAFRSKFLNIANASNNRFHHKYGRKIVQMFRNNSSQFFEDYKYDVKFSEFVQFLIKYKNSASAFDQHWTPVYELCSPCYVQYDFIGQFESMATDISLLLKEMSVEDQIPSFPDRNETFQRSEETITNYYGTIKTEHLTSLSRIYEHDYNLFGYPLPVNSSHLAA